MNMKQLIENYKASNVSIPKSMIGWMRSNHAGETGAVWIYIGAKCIFLCYYTVGRNFVEHHYQEQIEYLYKHSISFDLLKVLEICCAEEVEHQNDAESKKGKINNHIENYWSRIVGSGSGFAVSVSKLI